MDLPQLLEHFEFALSVMWFRASITVSDITVRAVFDRVLTEGSQKYKFFDCFDIQDRKIDLEQCYPKMAKLNREEMIEGFHYILTEFLAILGNLTGEVLSVQMHKTLKECKDLGLSKHKLKISK